MFSLFDLAWVNLSWALASLPQDATKVFWSSLVWGRRDPSWSAAPELTQLFFDLGMIHILVLSGSQVGSFMKVHQLLVGALLKCCGASRASFGAKLGIGAGWVLTAAYVWATGASAPLVRAFAVQSVSALAGPERPLRTIALSFVLHLVLFPSHWGTLSFALSWGAFLILVLLAHLKLSRLMALGVLCVSCHLLVNLMKGGSGVGSFGWKTLAANLLWVPFFEVLIFPLGSLLAWAALLSAFLGAKWSGEGIGRQIFDSALYLHEILAQVVLGGLEGIRYI